MKLVTFSRSAAMSVGVLDAETKTIREIGRGGGNAPSMLDLIRGGESAWTATQDAARSAGSRFPLSEVRLEAPLRQLLRNILCVGKNYRAHAAEFESSGFDASSQKEVVPQHPIIFTKGSNTVIADGDPIPASSDLTSSVDYEGELAVVIGRAGRNISAKDAFAHVFGYTLINDVTSRVLQGRHKQWFLGKNLDGFCPMGPVLVTRDEIPDVASLRLTTRVNGELRQNASVADLIFDIPTLIEVISAQITLEPGDIIATGTPEGVGIGFKPPRYLRSGDQVSVEMNGIGTLSNPVV